MPVEPERRSELEALAREVGEKLDDSSPHEILEWALSTFAGTLAMTASMADAVLIDMASAIAPDVDVIFLDTGYHFPETLETRDLVATRYPVKVHSTVPMQSVAQQDELFGPRLHDRDPDACCNLRKVEPLRRALEPFSAWASGIRRDESSTRRRIGVVEWDGNRSMVKVNPLAAWTQADVNAYIIEHDVPVNPLVYDGFPSIGCAPCTRRVELGADPRSGRWAGSGKSECGLHVDSSGRLQRGAGR